MTENTSTKEATPDPQEATPTEVQPASSPAQVPSRGRLRWLVQSLAQPLLIIAAAAVVIVGLGVAQKLGWITAGGGSSGAAGHASAAAENVRYICPMMCTPPQAEPGRCPVCAMELVPATSKEAETDGLSIQVDSVARRVANIRTVAVKAVPLTRRIHAIGELSYDEGRLKTIAAYIDGRLEKLYADYTGVVVEKGDRLALVYSPRLYSSQVELLVARRVQQQNRSAVASGTVLSNRSLYDSARERLIEFGMTTDQIAALEQADEANSRLHLYAPISGTVIEKLAVEGQYVKTGDPIYRLADLSTVWLMLELFPQDVSAIHYGQKVEAEVQSIPGRTFTGRVAFIDPTVDPKTRTVGVRVVMSNEQGLLRIGDSAKATISARIGRSGEPLAEVHDPELADKWISPRHPHVIESSPGTCRECGIDLVPAARFGFASRPVDGDRTLVVPRNAVLMAGQSSVVYVETEPGRFEIRRVVLGPGSGEEIAILEGVEEGEQVAYSGNFLIDSQMQLAGNPSLIDPMKAQPSSHMDEPQSPDVPPIGPMTIVDTADGSPSEQPPAPSNQAGEIAAALEKLSPEDRASVKKQRICPVAGMLLGSMGTPIKIDVGGTPVFICCEGCREPLLAEPAKYLAKLFQEVAK